MYIIYLFLLFLHRWLEDIKYTAHMFYVVFAVLSFNQLNCTQNLMMLNRHNIKALGLLVLDKIVFFMFSLYKPIKTFDPQDRASFGNRSCFE